MRLVMFSGSLCFENASIYRLAYLYIRSLTVQLSPDYSYKRCLPLVKLNISARIISILLVEWLLQTRSVSRRDEDHTDRNVLQEEASGKTSQRCVSNYKKRKYLFCRRPSHGAFFYLKHCSRTYSCRPLSWLVTVSIRSLRV